MTETTKISASCECGALVLQAEQAPVVQLVCHCNECRRLTGQPFVEAAFFKPDACSAQGETDAVVLKGASGADKTHHACAVCKTPLYVRVGALNEAWAVMADRLSPFTFEPQAHVWTSEKAESVQIPEGVRQAAGMPPKDLVDVMISSFWGGK